MAVTVKSGPMRHPVVIQQRTESLDSDTGEPGFTWAEWKRWWCALEPVTVASREKATGSGLLEEAEFVVRMRYVPDLTRKHRFLMNDGTYLEILALADVAGKTRLHEAICKTIVE